MNDHAEDDFNDINDDHHGWSSRVLAKQFFKINAKSVSRKGCLQIDNVGGMGGSKPEIWES